MLVSPAIQDDKARERIARQAALLIEAVQIHKQELGLPLVPPPADHHEVPLLVEAREALESARRENGHDVWGVIHHLEEHEATRRFLRI